jgi:acyl-CoA synthetase (AMP-forming)/AMP-acid ligase II
MKRVLCAGAPVPAALWEKPQRWLTNGQLHSPYGATESLPVSSVSADEIDPKTVRGACVGRSLPEITAKVIAITDEPIAALSEAHELPVGEIGEIIVRGPVVTRTYDALPEATAAAKIKDGADSWHRMGDCGYFDAAGRLWFCGRKVERVQTAAGVLFTEPCEQVFRSYPLVVRCALIGLGEPGAQTPALVVQPIADKTLDQRALAHELRRLAVAHDHTRGIERFYFHNNFPVDVRHNAKIHRLQLARWARTAQIFKVTA